MICGETFSILEGNKEILWHQTSPFLFFKRLIMLDSIFESESHNKAK